MYYPSNLCLEKLCFQLSPYIYLKLTTETPEQCVKSIQW